MTAAALAHEGEEEETEKLLHVRRLPARSFRPRPRRLQRWLVHPWPADAVVCVRVCVAPVQDEAVRINTIELVAASIRGDVAAVKRIVKERDVDVNATDAVRWQGTSVVARSRLPPLQPRQPSRTCARV